MGCRVRQPWCTRTMSGTPKRGPLRVWIGTVCADLIFEILSLYELLESFLRDRLVHRFGVGWNVRVTSNHVPPRHHFHRHLFYHLLKSTTNLFTPIPSYFVPTPWSVFSRRLYRLRFHVFVAVPALLTASDHSIRLLAHLPRLQP